ncbi:MAG: FHA domain-containing protein [Planctomycetota bacterium]|jgi:pSer/pThr/pTyr-binding forkhead associated (FHA) protein
MRLFVSLGESSVNELKFDRGPIYLGRQMGSQVFLPDKSVSRQHAVFYTTKDGSWIIEDLGSSNKTYLNSQAIHKQEVGHNDVIRIADFLIRVSLEEDEDQSRQEQMEDTLVGAQQIHRDLHTVERNLSAGDAPPVKFPAKRMKHYHEGLRILCEQTTLDTLYKSVMDLLFREFKAMDIWMGMRKEPSGPMDVQGGRKLTTEHIERQDLAVPASLDEALNKNKYLLIHQLPRQIANRGIRSVIIAPIMVDQENHGIIYIENSKEHSHYSLPDLDYLILLSINAGYAIQKLR